MATSSTRSHQGFPRDDGCRPDLAVFEQAGRKLLGGLLGAIGGGLLAVSPPGRQFGHEFASTYALGQVARRYYAGGRIVLDRLRCATRSSRYWRG